jgi:phosphatidyl-myo-inositol dimannoside synthase
MSETSAIFTTPAMSRPARRRRRLLTVGRSYVVRVNRRLAHEMAKVGADDWEVVAAGPNYFHGTNDLRAIRMELDPSEPCRVVPIPAHFTGRVHAFVYGRRLRSLLAEDWDLVHCWEEPYIFAGGQIVWWTPRKTPLVVSTHQSISKRYPPPFGWIERYAIGRAIGWACSGTLVVEALGNRPGYDKPHAVIPLGVDVEAFRPDPAARRALLGRLGWTEGPPIVGYLGRFVPEKGVEFLTRVIDQVPGDWRAHFVGAGPLEAKLREWAARHGDRVRITTGVTHENVPAHLNAMDLLCAPSQTIPVWKEQFGRMVVEAFATGLPVIGSDSGEIPFVIKDTGLVVGEKDEAGWARAIAGLIADRSRREAMGAGGRERACSEFSWTAVARRHLEFFDTLLASRTAATS